MSKFVAWKHKVSYLTLQRQPKYKLMKTTVKYKNDENSQLLFYFIIFVSISISGYAQENSTMKDTQNPKVQDMQRKYNRYLDAYLAVLSADERKVLFASYKRGMSEEYLKQYTSEEESAYQSRIRKWDEMTDAER